MKYTCPYCGTEFESNRKNVQTCGSGPCQSAHAAARYKQYREEQDKTYYDDKNDSERLFYLLSKEDVELCLKHLDFLKMKMQPDRDIKFSEALSMLQSALSLHVDLSQDLNVICFSKETEDYIRKYVERVIFDMFEAIITREYGEYRGYDDFRYLAICKMFDDSDINKIYPDGYYRNAPRYIKLDNAFFLRNPQFAIHTAPDMKGRYLMRVGTDSLGKECHCTSCKNCIEVRYDKICALKTELINRTTAFEHHKTYFANSCIYSHLSNSQLIEDIHKCETHIEQIKADRIGYTLSKWLKRNFNRFSIDDYTKKCVYEIIEHQNRNKRWRDHKLMSKVKQTTDSYIQKRFMEENKILMAAYHKYTIVD